MHHMMRRLQSVPSLSWARVMQQPHGSLAAGEQGGTDAVNEWARQNRTGRGRGKGGGRGGWGCVARATYRGPQMESSSLDASKFFLGAAEDLVPMGVGRKRRSAAADGRQEQGQHCRRRRRDSAGDIQLLWCRVGHRHAVGNRQATKPRQEGMGSKERGGGELAVYPWRVWRRRHRPRRPRRRWARVGSPPGASP